MTLWQAIVLGAVQGLTEFLPISSTAHVYLVPRLLGVSDPGAAFTAVIQLGTLLAVLVFFAPDLWATARASVRALSDPRERESFEARLTAYLVVGTLPIGIAGLALKKHVESSFRSVYVVAASLIVVAIVLAISERVARHDRRMLTLTMTDVLLVGGAQALALIPGVSRSGATLAAALLIGLRREDAARFSFLLSIPAVAAAGIFEMRKAVHDLGSTGLLPLTVATIVSAVVGYATIAWLIRFLRTRSTMPFVIYRVALGVLLLALVGAGWLAPR